MPFDPSKDSTLKEWELETFFVSVRRYGESEPKLQIGPRFMGEVTSNFTKLGRLSLSEAEALSSCLGEVIEFMKNQN